MGNFVSPSAVSPTSYVVNQYTLLDLIDQAYRMAQAMKHPGQGLSPSEQQEGLDLTNHMLDGLKIENLLIVFYIRTLVQLVTGKKDYGVGPGQDWDIERPEKIHTAGFVLQAGTPSESELPMWIATTHEQYAEIVAKNVGSSIPMALYYRATLPYGTATIWPVANADQTQIALYTQGNVQEFLTVDDPVITPKGWRELIMYNLAVRVHQRYPQKPMDPSVATMAAAYKTRVMDQQLTPMYVGSDPAVLGEGRPWLSGLPKAWTPY